MITLITAWYNEEFLGPLFWEHYYDQINKIIVLLDEDTDDKTLLMKKLTEDFPKIEWRPLKMPDGMDDQLKIDQINDTAARLFGS